MEAECALEDRNDLDVRNQVVHVRIGTIVGSFFTVDGPTVSFPPQVERNHDKLPQFHSAPGHLLQRRDQTAMRHVLERTGVEIPGDNQYSEKRGCNRRDENYPERPAPRAGLGLTQVLRLLWLTTRR